MANIQYTIKAELFWGSGDEGIDFDLYGYSYVFDPYESPVVYWRNLQAGGLTLAGDAYPNCTLAGGVATPEVISGDYDVPCDNMRRFQFFWNHYASCEPEGGITERPVPLVTITNTGNTSIYYRGGPAGVDGVELLPGEEVLFSEDSIVFVEKEGELTEEDLLGYELPYYIYGKCDDDPDDPDDPDGPPPPPPPLTTPGGPPPPPPPPPPSTPEPPFTAGPPPPSQPPPPRPTIPPFSTVTLPPVTVPTQAPPTDPPLNITIFTTTTSTSTTSTTTTTTTTTIPPFICDEKCSNLGF